jgi:hypothetical protein
MRLFLAAAALLLGPLAPTRVDAATFTIPIEVQDVGTVTATIGLDGPSDSASWSLSVPLQLLPITEAGIYRDEGGQADPLLIEFSGLEGGPIVDSDVDAVLLYPTLYYVSLANGSYPAGTIRGDLPEPGTLGMLGSALAGVALLRRRIAARA